MKTLTLDVDELRVASFATEDAHEAEAAAITGTVCITRPTLYGTCCTP